MTRPLETVDALDLAREYNAEVLAEIIHAAERHAEHLRQLGQRAGGGRLKAARRFLRDADSFSMLAACATVIYDAAHAADPETPFSWNDPD